MSGWLTNGLSLQTPATFSDTNAGSGQIPVDTQGPSGVAPQTVAYPTSAGSQGAWTTYTAAGTSQGTATALTAFKNLITVALTASTKGVKLPTAVTGLEILVANGATFGAKVYPASGAQIGAASTNAADSTVLAINKANRYLAVSAVKWIVLRGA
jgi:hypothetical protein